MNDLTYGAASIRTSGNTQTVTYQQLSERATRSGKCPCGKRRTRSTTFTATVNPFNKDPKTGHPRTPQQVQATLSEEAAAWVPDFTCTSHEFVYVMARIVGSPGEWETVYTRGSMWYGDLRSAQRAGARNEDGTDDFLIVMAEADRLLAVLDAHGTPVQDWSSESYGAVAHAFGLQWAGAQ